VAIAALAVFALAGAAAPSFAGITYNVTNATTVQNGYSLSGYLEVSGTGNVTSFSSYNLTATKADNPTLTFVGSGTRFISGVMIATDSALYLPSGSALGISGNADGTMAWYNNFGAGINWYLANTDFGNNVAWDSSSYPNTDVNGWRIGSVQAAVPEIDPATGSSALSLVAGVLAMIEQRRRRAILVA